MTGKTFPAFPVHAHPQFCVSGKRPMPQLFCPSTDSEHQLPWYGLSSPEYSALRISRAKGAASSDFVEGKLIIIFTTHRQKSGIWNDPLFLFLSAYGIVSQHFHVNTCTVARCFVWITEFGDFTYLPLPECGPLWLCESRKSHKQMADHSWRVVMGIWSTCCKLICNSTGPYHICTWSCYPRVRLKVIVA